MTFYKLLDIENNVDVYVNPTKIEFYVYHSKSVELCFTSNEYIMVNKSDFENMMILEDANEY